MVVNHGEGMPFDSQLHMPLGMPNFWPISGCIAMSLVCLPWKEELKNTPRNPKPYKTLHYQHCYDMSILKNATCQLFWCIGTGELGPGFFFQFCDVAEVAIIHKMI
jgi:hypothetical protein